MRIIEIAELIEYIARMDVSNRDKAEAVKVEIANGLISYDEGIELIVHYTF